MMSSEAVCKHTGMGMTNIAIPMPVLVSTLRDDNALDKMMEDDRYTPGSWRHKAVDSW